MTILKTLVTVGVAVLLVACGSTAPVTQYYQLPDSAFRLPEKSGREVGVKVVLAEPINGENLLYQSDEYTLTFAQKNLWAAPLDETLVRSLANKLNRVGSLKYVPASQNKRIDLTIFIDRFQGSFRGETEISGYAQYANGAQIPFHVLTAQQGDGYAAMLASLNVGLDSVARQIGK
ncbi:PqiC family protein [Kingella negevensis]|uniref:PqiC family protein n=1 Tax=Kingella negevensis TaxID=1522312 RepID=UPI0005C5F598|nr:ABC-type transport auxiliary lipoprotein family protein [Kingella negevensis]MDK4688699.1 ABC-type transport auxiliary lipoprotein family protein [Kingella negevensis]WII91558.1 ABC-type transport auxiliary lipoprotein family protein [Kingella negevensis]